MHTTSIKTICERYGAEFLPNTPIASYTTFKIGGVCDIIKVNGIDVLTETVRYCKAESVPFHALGKGSNVLISDKGLPGIILLIGSGFGKIDISGETITAGAGKNCPTYARPL